MHSNGVAILPENMSNERFDWLNSINAEIIKAPNTESSIKEVLDISNKLVKEGKGKIISLNQLSPPITEYRTEKEKDHKDTVFQLFVYSVACRR